MREWESYPPDEVYETSLCALVEFPAINCLIGTLRSSSCVVTLGSFRMSKTPIERPNQEMGPGTLCSRPCAFQERTYTAWHFFVPTRGFMAVLSVFRGTPPPKPLNCKVWENSCWRIIAQPGLFAGLMISDCNNCRLRLSFVV